MILQETYYVVYKKKVPVTGYFIKEYSKLNDAVDYLNTLVESNWYRPKSAKVITGFELKVSGA